MIQKHEQLSALIFAFRKICTVCLTVSHNLPLHHQVIENTSNSNINHKTTQQLERRTFIFILTKCLSRMTGQGGKVEGEGRSTTTHHCCLPGSRGSLYMATTTTHHPMLPLRRIRPHATHPPNTLCVQACSPRRSLSSPASRGR